VERRVHCGKYNVVFVCGLIPFFLIKFITAIFSKCLIVYTVSYV
jgi:hypothetical protein